ncbi:MAG: MFS transporter [Verrucomicrobiota bacterium]
MKKKTDRNVYVLGLTSLFNDWSSEMIFPLLPAFMAQILNIPKPLIGLIEGVSRSLASILKFFSGYISDRLGRRKALAVTGYALSNIVRPFLALAHTWWAVLAVRAADRFGKGVRTAPRDALLASSTEKTKKTRGRSFGFHRAMDTTGAMLGTICAYFLLRFLPWDMDMNYRTVFLLAVIPGAIGTAYIILGTKEQPVTGARRKPSLNWKKLPANIRKLVIASVIFGIGNYTFTFFILRIFEMGVSQVVVPLVYLFYNIVYMAASIPAGRLSDRIGRKKVLMAGFVLYALTATGFALLNSLFAAWALMGLFGLHMAMTDATARAFISDLADEEVRGTALGVYHTGVGIADLPAGLLAGFLWAQLSSSATFLAGAVLAFVSIAVLATVKEK